MSEYVVAQGHVALLLQGEEEAAGTLDPVTFNFFHQEGHVYVCCSY